MSLLVAIFFLYIINHEDSTMCRKEQSANPSTFDFRTWILVFYFSEVVQVIVVFFFNVANVINTPPSLPLEYNLGA